MTISASIAGMMTRELRALKRELEAYPNDAEIWRLAPPIANSAGTLTLHLVGNLRHYVGARFAGNGYVRNRDVEFRDRDIPGVELLARIDATIRDVEAGLARVTPAQLDQPFPELIAGMQVLTGDFLVHLAAHAAYHLGQVDYHRRLLAGSAVTIGAVAISELSTARKA